MKRLSHLTVVVLIAAIATAQQGYFETFEVRLHNLDVVVTDAKGNPVHGLTKDDFIVLEDGVPKTITNFSVYDEGTSTVASVTGEAAEPAQEKAPPRRFVFFVDDMAVQENARHNLIRHATALVDQMREGDLGTVIRPTGVNRVAQDYTTDKAALRKVLTGAIESCTIRNDAPGLQEMLQLSRSLSVAHNNDERNYVKGIYAQQVRDRVQQRLSQLRAVIGSTAGLEGRKVLVVITAGLPSYPGRDAIDFEAQMKGETRQVTEWGQTGNFKPLIDELARTAASHGVTIYGLEPEVPVTPGVQKSAGSRTVGTTQRKRPGILVHSDDEPTVLHVAGSQIMPQQMLPELLHYRGETLTSLTEKTGGKWFRGVGTIDDVFRQVASDMSVYYSLAYRATGARDQPRRIEVRIRNRPELHARTRTEVVDRSPDREMADVTFANLLFPRDVNELKITLTAGKPAGDGRAYIVPLDVVIPLDKLTFAQIDGGKYAAVADIHFAAAGLTNNFATSGRQRQNIEITAEQHAARAGITTRFKTGMQVPKGRTRIAVGVMDEASRMTGFNNVEVVAE
ncbi:MAG: VWA domain-containing protein [Thermoanaerobaculia bacterium]